MSKDLVQSGALELVRAGVISYRQLNEVHRLLSETGGNLDDLLVERGYATRDQLKLRHRSKREGLAASMAMLQQHLTDNGMTYDAFVWTLARGLDAA